MPAGTLPLILALVAPQAGAAEATDIPPWLRADVGVAYRFDHTGGSLVQGDEEVGRRTVNEHRVVYRGVVTAVPGAAFFLEAEQIVQERVSFPMANEMAYDPSGVHAGTMAGTDPLDAVSDRSGSGFQGVWIGLRGTPFSETFPRRPSMVTWMLEAAVRTANDSPFWTVQGGNRGAGDGGSAWRVASAFSRRKGTRQPYLGVTWIRTGTYLTDLQDLNGRITAESVELTGPDTLDVRAGVEFGAEEKPAGSRVALDLHTGFVYRSWETLPSGIMLPEALELTQDIPVTGAETLGVEGGLGVHWRPFRYLQFDLAGEAGWVMPHEIEHPYPVLTGPDTVAFDVSLGMTARIR